MWMGYRVSIPTLVELDALDQAIDSVVLLNGIRITFQNKDAAALRSAVAIRRSVERTAAAGGAKKVSSI